MFDISRSYQIIVSGETGDGKTMTAVSFALPEGPTSRLVIDGEARAGEYQAKDGQDHPERFQWAFDTYPGPYDELKQVHWTGLLDAVLSNNWAPLNIEKPNVLVIDNWTLVHDSISEWMAQKDRAGKLLEQAGMKQQFSGFLAHSFVVGPRYFGMVKDYEAAVFRIFKRAGIHVILTTPRKNVWDNFGVPGLAADGLPKQRILGRTADCGESVIQMADVIWILTRRKTTLLAKPDVQQDFLNPKASIVGVPPRFTWSSWAQIWQYAEARVVATAETLAEITRPEPTFGGETGETDDPIIAGRARLVTELGVNWTPAMLEAYLRQLKLTYTVEEHEDLRTALETHHGKIALRDTFGKESGPEIKKAIALLGLAGYDLAHDEAIRAAVLKARNGSVVLAN